MPAQNNSSPPEDITAEFSTLGAMLIERQAIEKVRCLLNKNDFVRKGHQTLFEIICSMDERDIPVDFITIQAELKERGEFEAIGGVSYLTNLMDTVPTAANVEYYAKIVLEKSLLRQIGELGNEANRIVQAPAADITKAVSLVERTVSHIAERLTNGTSANLDPRKKPLEENLIEMRDAWAAKVAEPPRIIGDLIVAGCETLLSAPSGAGKTTLAYHILTHIAEGKPLWGMDVPKPRKVLVVDLETPDFTRTAKLQKLYLDEPPVKDKVYFLPEIDLPGDLPKLLAICKKFDIELVAFDTASRCFHRTDENSSSEVYERVTPILDRLKAEGIASFTIAHTGKNSSGTRGSSAFEDAVDIVLSLEIDREEKQNPDAFLTLRTLKNRVLGFPDSIFLQRAGNDNFNVVADVEPQRTAPIKGPSAAEKCATAVLAFLQSQNGKPVRHTDICNEMVKQDHAKGTAKHVITDLQKIKKQICHNGVGYVLADRSPPE